MIAVSWRAGRHGRRTLRNVGCSHASTSDVKVCLMGTAVSAGNLGVRALATALIDLSVVASPNARVTLLLGHDRPDVFVSRNGGREYVVPIVNSRLSPRARLQEHLAWIVVLAVIFRFIPSLRSRIVRANRWIGAIAEADLVGDIRGGDSFSDIYGLTRFIRGSVEAWTVLLVRGEIVHFPQTYGPFRSRLGRLLAAYLLRRSSVIIARDRESGQLAEKLVGKRKNVLLSPDVAFSLEPVVPPDIVFNPPRRTTRQSRIIGLNVNGLMYYGGYNRQNMFGLRLDYAEFLTMWVKSVLREGDTEMWIIPHTRAADVESDGLASDELRGLIPEHLRGKVHIVAERYDQHEIKGIIGKCEFFVGSRMHSCVAALSQGIPCVGVAYSMKFKGVFESVGMRDWVIDARTVDSQGALEHAEGLYRRRHDARSDLRVRALEARQELDRVFRSIIPVSAERER